MMDFLSQHWMVLLIPFVSAFVGWFTNVLAIKMMFYPIDFIGIRPFLGWQGIIPANAIRMAGFASKLIAERLLSLPALLSGFDPKSFVRELTEVIDRITDEVITEVADKRAPAMWAALAPAAQGQVRAMVRAEVEEAAARMLGDLQERIDEVLDLQKVTVDAVRRDRRLISEMFLRVGSKEFTFIARSGIWFGFAFGILQMAVWVVWPAWWMLPLAGFFVGYLTNWLALKLIFEPRYPRRVGRLIIQGLFHKRQREVSHEFATMVAADVLSPDNIVTTMTSGPARERLLAIVGARVRELIDKYRKHPMAMMLGPDVATDLQADVLKRVEDELPRKGGVLHVFASKAVDIKNALITQMVELDPESFEGVLRPAFQQDEWKLILAGAVLGMGAGVMQVVFMFKDVLA
ncbi:MAG: hypothetical protein AMXMBFR64_42720 [Myxococcales bacterium]